MKKLVWSSFVGFFCLALCACGGGGGPGGGPPAPTEPVPVTPPSTGVFVDSAVENIYYETKTQKGYTNDLGQFKYAIGETVTFSIGGIKLPTVTAGATITPLDLAQSSGNPTGSNTADVFANLLVLLQSLDADQDPTNGIKLTEESKSLPNTGFSIYVSPSEFSSSEATGSLKKLIATARVKDKTGALVTLPVSLESAQTHFKAANPSIKLIALATSSGNAVVGNTITLNGNGSYDANGQTLSSYSWSVTGKPAYSIATINNPALSTASLSIDVAGDYVVKLSVTNSLGLSNTHSITVKGAPNPKFGASILTLYATTTGLNVACNPPDDSICDKRLAALIHTEKLGCVTCDATQEDSICNFNGKYGSLSGPKSIWNTAANQYGDPSNQSSPWNSNMGNADQGTSLRLMPILLTAFNDVIDERASAFTLNTNSWLEPYLPDNTNEPLLIDMLAAYTVAEPSASAKRAAVCSTLAQAMQ